MPARDDAVEVVQVGGEVQREPVTDDRAVELDSDRGHLLAVRPDAGEAAASRLGCDAKLTQEVDQGLLEALQVFGNRAPKMLEVEDRVTHELARAVIGRLAAPVRPDDVHIAARALVLVPQQMVRARGPAHGEYVGMLQKQQRVRRVAISHLAHQLGLEVPDRAVAGATQPAGSYGRGLAYQRDRT